MRVVLAALVYQIVHADPLDLDLSFNGTGKVVTEFVPGDSVESATAIAIAPDGKIVVVGSASIGSTYDDFAIVRYKPDGSIDQTFGTNGRVTTDFTTDSSSQTATDRAVGVVIQPDGKIVVAGTVTDFEAPGDDNDIALARYGPDGTLDPSFGTNGRVRLDVNEDFATGIALQADGKIVVAGTWYGPKRSGSDGVSFLIARFLQNGALDTGFGDGGKVFTDFGYHDSAHAVAIQNDGKIVAVGSTSGPNPQPLRGVLARYNPNGTLDQSFSGSLGMLCVLLHSCGKIAFKLGDGLTPDVALAPLSMAVRKADATEDGRIVIAGGFGLARFNANGSLDKDFANSGIMDSPDNTGHALAILANGQIVVAGTVAGEFATAIYEPNGERCPGKGSVTTDFSADFGEAQAIGIQSDGKIVVAGSAGDGNFTDRFAVARYQGGECPPKIWLGHYVTVHVFIHPQDLVGPPAPILRRELYKQLQIGRAERLAIPASDGGTFTGPMRSGYEAFELTGTLAADRQRGSLVAVTTPMGNSLLELLEAHRLLVPTAIQAGRTGAPTSSPSRSPVLKCYRVKVHNEDGPDRAKKRVTVTDALNRTWPFELGEPESFCKPIDSHGRELTGPATGLVSYQVNDIGGRASAGSPRLAVVNEFGSRIIQSGQPASILVPAVAE